MKKKIISQKPKKWKYLRLLWPYNSWLWFQDILQRQERKDLYHFSFLVKTDVETLWIVLAPETNCFHTAWTSIRSQLGIDSSRIMMEIMAGRIKKYEISENGVKLFESCSWSEKWKIRYIVRKWDFYGQEFKELRHIWICTKLPITVWYVLFEVK